MKNKSKLKSKIALTLTALAFAGASVGCAPQNSQAVNQASQSITKAFACENMKSMVFDSFYQMIDESKAVPSVQEMKQSLSTSMDRLKIEKNFSQDEAKTVDQITEAFNRVIELMLRQSSDMTSASWKEQIEQIIRLEMQNQSSPQIIATHTEINQLLTKVKKLSESTSATCDASFVPQSEINPMTPPNTSLVVGLNRVVATAYQSCRVLDLPAMNRSTASVEGISISGKHADGVGSKRVIGNLKKVQNTHYYIKDIATESSCLAVRDNPLIYDYGGQALVTGNTLNYFKNSGSGTAVLGVDCSAFVSSAIAMSGFRYKPDLPNKAIYTRQTAREFIDAAASGFTCFDNVTVTAKQSILAGDIVGVKGHVVAIDKLGKDPFGLALISKESDCGSINYKNFDIDIAQSSPSKGGIGINKFKVSDYLDETTKMRTAFVEMGKQACLAKFQNKSLKPKNSEWGFVRHKGTPECLAPRVTMTGEACVQKCY